MSDVELTFQLAKTISRVRVLELELESERKRGDRWREMADGYDDLRSELRLCGDDADGHAEFYQAAADLFFPDCQP